MSVITIYKCDKCDKEQSTGEQMWPIGIVVSYQSYAKPTEVQHEQLWCRECMDKYQILSPVVKSDPVVPELTFEDKIREIIRDEIEAEKSR